MQAMKQEFDSQVKQYDEPSLLHKTTKTLNFQNNQNAIQTNTIYFVYFSVPS